MSFFKFWRKPKETTSSKTSSRRKEGRIDPDKMGVDLFAQLTYMSAISDAGVGRSQLFEYASSLPYSCNRYFEQVHFLAKELHYDYARACRTVGQSIKEEEMRGLLLRFSGSLSSGESETEFLHREAQAQAETYGSQYEREVETLKKWTDAYVAMVVASVIVVIVAVVSMLMPDFGLPFLMFLIGTMITVTILGTWLVYRVAPHEVKTHSLSIKSPEQTRASGAWLRVLLPACLLSCVALFAIGTSPAWFLIVPSLVILPVGLLMRRDDKQIDRRDRDLPSVVRALGGVTSAVGTTVTDALNKIDQRSMGNLAPDIGRLRARLAAGVSPDLCWHRFVAESGSEMVRRTVQIFWDGIQLGGEPERIGLYSSLFSMKVVLLRAKRSLVASTFSWLVPAPYRPLTALLVFILILGIQSTLANIRTSTCRGVQQRSRTPFIEPRRGSIFEWLVANGHCRFWSPRQCLRSQGVTRQLGTEDHALSRSQRSYGQPRADNGTDLRSELSPGPAFSGREHVSVV